MTLDTASTTFQSWTQAEVNDRKRWGQDKWEKLAQNQHVFNNLIETLDNAWARGSDCYDHFASAPKSGTTLAQKGDFYSDDNITHLQAGHKVKLYGGNSVNHGGVVAMSRFEADNVESLFETRAYLSAHDAAVSPYIGYVSALDDTTPTDGAYFVRGTNTNTWKCVTRSSSTDQTTTDNQAGSYVDWDKLRIEFRVASVKFFINDTEVASHTLNLPTSVLMYLCGQIFGASTAHELYHDYCIAKALANTLSP
jgi:hypothetical protein